MSRSRSGLSSPGIEEEEGGTVVLLNHVDDLLAQMKEYGRKEGGGKGKGRDTGDQAGEVLGRLAGLLKKSDGLRKVVNMDEVIQWYVA